MGEHAEDILDGSVCEGCGDWFDDVIQGGEAPGSPRKCRSCKRQERGLKYRREKPRHGAAFACAITAKGGGNG
jgi:hypothetical protein